MRAEQLQNKYKKSIIVQKAPNQDEGPERKIDFSLTLEPYELSSPLPDKERGNV